MTKRGVFGWHYPAGAEHDPRAPWNQVDEFECVECHEFFSELDDKDMCEECHGTWFCLDMVVWVKAEDREAMKKEISKRLDGSTGHIDFAINEVIEDESP
jgi:hypothetical protein